MMSSLAPPFPPATEQSPGKRRTKQNAEAPKKGKER